MKKSVLFLGTLLFGAGLAANTVDMVDEALKAGFEEQGLQLDEASEAFLIDTVKGFLGLSKAEEEGAAKPKPMMKPAFAKSPAMGNSLELDEANVEAGAIFDALKGLGSAVAGGVSSLAGKVAGALGPKPAAEEAAENSLELDEANVEAGAIFDALKGLGSAVAGGVSSLAGKVAGVLGPKPAAEEAAAE